MQRLNALFEQLASLPSSDGLMNPYSTTGSFAADSLDEIGPVADRIRTANLRSFLLNALRRPRRVLLVGEAPGHNGARWTGIAFTSEREVASGTWPHLAGCEILPGARSGARTLNKEPSAQAIWEAISRQQVSLIPWNSLPCHPHQPGRARTNRTPKKDEVALGRGPLEAMIALLDPELVLPIGNTAAGALKHLGIVREPLRHPAYGGKPVLLRQLEQMGLISPCLPSTQVSLL